MRSFAFFIAIMALSLQLEQAADIAVWSSYVGTNRYDFSITSHELEKTPRWKQSSDCPPLAPGKALRLSRMRLEQLLPDEKHWTLGDIKLDNVRDDYWIYEVLFLGPVPVDARGLPSDLPPHMTIPVLMNGIAVKPRIRPWKGSKPPNKSLQPTATTRGI